VGTLGGTHVAQQEAAALLFVRIDKEMRESIVAVPEVGVGLRDSLHTLLKQQGFDAGEAADAPAVLGNGDGEDLLFFTLRAQAFEGEFVESFPSCVAMD
jgi:hypothetical protein